MQVRRGGDPQMKVRRDCPACGATYDADPVRLRHGRQTTCSRSCSYQLRAATLRTAVDLTCSACGDQFKRAPAAIKSKHQGVYCSRQCHYRGRSLGLTKRVVVDPYVVTDYDRKPAARKAWTTRRKRGTDRHSEATKAKLRSIAIRRMSGTARAVSGLENEVAEELTRRGVVFDRQVGIRDPTTGRFCACVDFVIGGCAIEINGSYWHADPRVYPGGPGTPSQWRTVIRYARKRGHLFRLGVPLIEVWESDIRENIANAIDRALALVSA